MPWEHRCSFHEGCKDWVPCEAFNHMARMPGYEWWCPPVTDADLGHDRYLHRFRDDEEM